MNVYVDFDGTIAPSEPTDALFDRFAAPTWRDIEVEWQRGKLTSRQCIERQVALLRATPDEVDGFLSTVQVDPQFPDFVQMCRRVGAKMLVVSDGLDRVVDLVLRQAGLTLPHAANHLVYQGSGRWGVEFPHESGGCRVRMGNCKCSHRAHTDAGAIDVLVGDGRSDFCLAQDVDLVLAKDQLARHCSAAGLPYLGIANFAEATQILGHWLRDRAKTPAAATKSARLPAVPSSVLGPVPTHQT